MIDTKEAENGKLRQWFLRQKWNYNTLGKARKDLIEFFIHKVAFSS